MHSLKQRAARALLIFLLLVLISWVQERDAADGQPTQHESAR